MDLGSQNGTRVNGERLVGARVLGNGDVVTICNTSLVYHSSLRQQGPRQLLSLADFRQRVEDELERAVRFGKTMGLAAIAFPAALDRSRLAASMAARLRAIDLLCLASGDVVLVLFPESSVEEAEVALRRAFADLGEAGKAARAGVAGFPTDG